MRIVINQAGTRAYIFQDNKPVKVLSHDEGRVRELVLDLKLTLPRLGSLRPIEETIKRSLEDTQEITLC